MRVGRIGRGDGVGRWAGRPLPRGRGSPETIRATGQDDTNPERERGNRVASLTLRVGVPAPAELLPGSPYRTGGSGGPAEIREKRFGAASDRMYRYSGPHACHTCG